MTQTVKGAMSCFTIVQFDLLGNIGTGHQVVEIAAVSRTCLGCKIRKEMPLPRGSEGSELFHRFITERDGDRHFTPCSHLFLRADD